MSDLTPAPRRYTDAEIRHLLERATEIRQAEPEAPDSGDLTLPELEEVAREAGIDVMALRRAAEELDAARTAGRAGPPAESVPGPAVALAGAPMAVALERTVTGEVPRDALEQVIPILQAAAEAPGHGSVAAHTLTWSARHPTNLRQLQVVVGSRHGETRIRIEERYGALAGTIFGSGIGGVGAGVGFGVGMGVGAAIGSTLMMVAFPLVLLGGTYLGSRLLFAGIVRSRRSELEQLLVTVADEIRASTVTQLQAEPEPEVD